MKHAEPQRFCFLGAFAPSRDPQNLIVSGEVKGEGVYATIAETLELRELRYPVVEKGRRTKMIAVVTTLTDMDEYSKKDIAELYGFRWYSELDIRSIKTSLNLAHLRCKSP